MPTMRDGDGVVTFANRRDEVAQRVKEHMEHYLQQNEGVHKELASLENKRLELIAVAEVLQAVINGLSSALNTAHNTDLPGNIDYNSSAAHEAKATAKATGINWS